MADNTPGSGGRQNRWPRTLDHKDPEGIASFLLHFGYDEDAVVNTLVSRCSLDRLEAKRIVESEAHKTT